MSRVAIVIAAAVGMLAATAAPARAEHIYHVEGEADAGGSDPKVAALDTSFAAAVREALADLVAPAELKAHKADVDRELVGRARRWVVSYDVTSDTTEGDARKLLVDVRIDTTKLTARLTELGIALSSDPSIDPVGPGPGPVNTGGKKATVLLRVITARGVLASYGARAERDVPGLAPLSAAVRAAGWQLISAPASGPAADKDEQMLDDDSARALAASAGADLAVIVAVDAAAPGEVRGTADHAALARARVRIVDRAGGVVGDGTALAGARGTTDDVVGTAITGAAVDAFADAAPAGVGGSGAGPVSAISPGAGEVLIKITARDKGDTPAWSIVRAIKDKLATTKGAVVAIRRLATREVVLGVRGGDRGADKLARDIRDLEHKVSNSSFTTKVNGNVVDVKVSGSP